MTGNYFDSEHFTITLIEKHILYIFIKDFMELQKEDIVLMQGWVMKNTNKQKLINLTQLGIGTVISREAREYAASEEGNILTIGTAVVVKNLAQGLLLNYYIKFNRPIKPTRAFYNKEKAMLWINGILENA
jgi:hypothetical protein